jgi:hypothetical protein
MYNGKKNQIVLLNRYKLKFLFLFCQIKLFLSDLKKDD